MERIKNFFQTPKKAVLTIACAAAVTGVLAAGTVLASERAAKQSSIGEEQAKNFAFADAGISPEAAEYTKVEFDHEQGQFIYEVDFLADNTEYEYWIKASDGTVVKKQSELLVKEIQPTADASENAALAGGGTKENNTTDSTVDNSTAGGAADGTTDSTAGGANAETAGSYIGVDKAKTIAVEHAGLSSDSVTFSKAKLENDDGIVEYEIEFYRGRMEYEYNIHAESGEILEFDSEYEDD